MLIRITLCVLVAFLSACSSGKLVKTYSGEALPKAEVASLTAGENLVLVSVNGERVPEYLLSNISVDYALKPGANKVVFQYESVWAKPTKSDDDGRSEAVVSSLREVDIEAQAGQRLTFSYPEADNVREARALAAKFDADVVDQSGKVLARSHDVTSETQNPVASKITPPSSGGAAPSQSVVGNASGLKAADAIRLMWNEMTHEEQKEFLKWAFQ